MRGLAGQNAPIDGLGFVQPALPVKGEALLELGGGIGGAHRPPTLAQNGARQPFLRPPALSGRAACSVRIRKVKLSSI